MYIGSPLKPYPQFILPMPADWSDLPGDLLRGITDRNTTSPELLASVCRSWRSSLRITTTRRRLSTESRTIPSAGIADASRAFHLSHRTIYLIQNPHQQQSPFHRSWTVKVEEEDNTTVLRNHRLMKLMNPLSCRHTVDPNLPDNFPKVLDSRKFIAKELGQEYILRQNYSSELMYPVKVAMTWVDNSGIMLLAIDPRGKLAVFRSGDRRWTVCEEGSPRRRYDDVVAYGGSLLGVDDEGTVVRVEKDTADLALVANPISGGGGKKKYLVESREHDALLLVDAYGTRFGNRMLYDWTSRFKVYRLIGEEKKWVEVRRLGNNGDGVLFIGEGSVFESSSPSSVGLERGNRIAFAFGDRWVLGGRQGIGFYDLTSDHIGNLLRCSFDGDELIWPPPKWLLSCKWNDWPRGRRRRVHRK